MPGASPKPLLAEDMLVVGVDAHKTYPPIPPAFCAHVVTTDLAGDRSPETTRRAPSVHSPAGPIVGRGHEVGKNIPHAPTNGMMLLVPSVMMASSSKSEFGVRSVQVLAADGNPYPVAIANGGTVGLQLHCQDVPMIPAPTGTALAFPNASVVAGFTDADLAGSLAALVADIIVQYAINTITSFAAGKAADFLQTQLVRSGSPVAILVGVAARPIVESWIGVGIGEVIGGPMGWAPRSSIYTQLTELHLFPTGDDAFNYGHAHPDWTNQL